MKRLSILILVLFIGLWLSSCDQNTSSLNSNEAEIQELVEGDYNEYFDDDVDFVDAIDQYSEDNFSSPLDGLNKIATPINPESVIKFGRYIRRDYGNDFPRKIFVVIEDDTAFVNVSRTLGGQFVILEKLAQNGDTVTVVRHKKELYHYIEKKAVFVRRDVPDSAEARGAWKLIAISGASGKSRPFDRNTLNIKYVTLINNSTGEEFTFSDPLGKLKRIPNELPVLHRGDMITMRVVVENVADSVLTLPNGMSEVVQIHFGIRPKYRHAKRIAKFVGKTDEGFNVYEIQWSVMGMADRPHHFVVDVINAGTIFDSDEETFPYNSTTWSFPYLVK